MGALEQLYSRVAAGEVVPIRFRGAALEPLISDGDLVEVAPADPTRLERGDLVVAHVAGKAQLRRVVIFGPQRATVLLGNTRGGFTGWTSADRVAGIVTAVDGRPRPGARRKTLRG